MQRLAGRETGQRSIFEDLEFCLDLRPQRIGRNLGVVGDLLRARVALGPQARNSVITKQNARKGDRGREERDEREHAPEMVDILLGSWVSAPRFEHPFQQTERSRTGGECHAATYPERADKSVTDGAFLASQGHETSGRHG